MSGDRALDFNFCMKEFYNLPCILERNSYRLTWVACTVGKSDYTGKKLSTRDYNCVRCKCRTTISINS